jgi:hypothetical protein
VSEFAQGIEVWFVNGDAVNAGRPFPPSNATFRASRTHRPLSATSAPPVLHLLSLQDLLSSPFHVLKTRFFVGGLGSAHVGSQSIN